MKLRENSLTALLGWWPVHRNKGLTIVNFLNRSKSNILARDFNRISIYFIEFWQLWKRFQMLDILFIGSIPFPCRYFSTHLLSECLTKMLCVTCSGYKSYFTLKLKYGVDTFQGTMIFYSAKLRKIFNLILWKESKSSNAMAMRRLDSIYFLFLKTHTF